MLFLGILIGISLTLFTILVGSLLFYLTIATRVRPEEQAVYDFTKNVPPQKYITLSEAGGPLRITNVRLG